MYGSYGYTEEGKLGKPYNLRHLKRLSRYALPYRKVVAVTLLLTILLAGLDLVIPYFSKIAIDRYILSAWCEVNLGALSTSERRNFLNRYQDLLVRGEKGTYAYLSHEDLKRLDPADRHGLRSQGLLSSERLYNYGLAPESRIPDIEVYEQRLRTTVDGSLLIPYDLLNRLPDQTVLKIRANDVRGTAIVAGLYLLCLLFSFSLGYYHHYLLEFTGQRVMQDIRLQLFQRMQAQSLRFFDRHPVGRLVTRVTNDIENLNEMFKSVLITVFKDFFLLTGILIVLVYLDRRLALVSFALLPVIFAVTYLFSSQAREIFRELRSTVAKINSFLQERLSGMRIIQLFANEVSQSRAFSRINEENFMAGMRQVRIFAIFMPIMELISAFGIALIIWYGGGKVVQEELTLGTLVAFIGYIQMFFKPIRDISEKYNIMQSAMASMERIFEFMDHEEKVPDPVRPRIPERIRGHLVLEHVSFGYEPGRPVIRDVSFEVEPGQTVAIVGPTGAGKTTLINLVERFYDPDAGRLVLDGVDLKMWPKQRLRREMGMCTQDVFLFAGTIAENILLARNGLGKQAAENAAGTSNAESFIRRLPDGFDQELGEGGFTLSAGQRQLLSFARALASDPHLLILDEATSSVDPETEHLIQEAISRIASHRTTLVVAHRISTIQNADRILVMHHGRIVERGTHRELMDIEGIYYRLNRLRQGALG